jgi:hypothetical protein
LPDKQSRSLLRSSSAMLSGALLVGRSSCMLSAALVLLGVLGITEKSKCNAMCDPLAMLLHFRSNF